MEGLSKLSYFKSARLFLQGLNLNLESIVRMYHFPLHTWDISFAKTFLNEKKSAFDQSSSSVKICDAVLTHRVVQYCCQIYISQIKTSDNPVKRSQIWPSLNYFTNQDSFPWMTNSLDQSIWSVSDPFWSSVKTSPNMLSPASLQTDQIQRSQSIMIPIAGQFHSGKKLLTMGWVRFGILWEFRLDELNVIRTSIYGSTAQ